MRENSASTETLFKAKLDEWGVREENVIYDYWGVGQAISGHVKRAVKFTGTQKPERQFEKSYKNVKSQCAEMLAHYIQDGKISIEPRLLDLKFSGKKGKYQKVPLKDILMKERKSHTAQRQLQYRRVRAYKQRRDDKGGRLFSRAFSSRLSTACISRSTKKRFSNLKGCLDTCPINPYKYG